LVPPCSACDPGRIGVVAAALLSAFYFSSCADERPVSPEPTLYNAYAIVQVPGGAAIDIIDMEADTVLRQIPSAGSAVSDFVATSPDGRYLATASTYGLITLFDLQTEFILGSVQLAGSSVTFTSDPSRLIGCGGKSTVVLSLPDLEVDGSVRIFVFVGRTLNPELGGMYGQIEDSPGVIG
jgi:WD40 repeat protein